MICFILFSCSQNLYDGIATNKTSNEALYEDALKSLDDQNYDVAIAKFEAMSSDFASVTVVRENWAGALAGKCGFNFLNYFNYFSTAPGGSPTFFNYLMTPWVQVETLPDYCKQAESKIKEIWVNEAASAKQQLFIAILSLAKMGSYVRSDADQDSTGNLGDGSADAGFDSCAAGSISDADVAELVTGISLFLQNIAGFSATLGGVSGFATDMTTACALLTPNPCATTEAANVTAGMITSVRKLLDSTVAGIGACADPTMATCCP